YQKKGEPISGRSELINLIGEKAVIAVETWCGSSEVQEPIVPTTTPADITTDSGASDAFAKAKSGQLIYRDDTDTWFKRDGQVFRPISYVQVQGEAKHFMQEQVGSAGFIGSTRSLLSKGKIDNLLALSRHQFRVEPGLLDECKYLVGCSDGTVLDLGTQSLIQTSALVTKTVRCRLDPNADYPRFKKFLSEVFAENQSVISFLQRAVGYSLAGYLDEQCMFFLVGKGSNGKTTLLNTIQHVFGDYAATTPAQTLVASRHGNQQTNDLAKLVGIRFVTASETEKGERLAESKLKRITGGDRIKCRGLYEEFFEYDPQFKLWLATNDPPNFSGGDYSISRRIYVVEFPVTFDAASRDHGLQARLLNEASGILKWALQGYAEWRMQGLNPPKDVMLATKSYTTENDSVGQFIDACCIIEPTAKETTGKLHQAYEDWCRESGIEPLPSNSFGKELKRRDFEPIKARRGNGWRGLKLRTDENLNTDLEAVGRVASDNDTGDSKISEADNNALQG
ncbi:MAG TPA: phage/plasmid primase, P4 family, partial [Pyrinomonadaceae bacterium]